MPVLCSPAELAKMLDHSLLHPTMTDRISRKDWNWP